MASPLKGPAGNIEFLANLRLKSGPNPVGSNDVPLQQLIDSVLPVKG
jgi:hypothetical protein